MAEIYDYSDTLITESVQLVLPRPDANEVKNKTLDGAFHLQTVGIAAKTVDVVAYVAHAGKLALDNAKAMAAPVKVTGAGKFHRGPIGGDLQVEYMGPNFYKVQFTILQQSEGAI